MMWFRRRKKKEEDTPPLSPKTPSSGTPKEETSGPQPETELPSHGEQAASRTEEQTSPLSPLPPVSDGGAPSSESSQTGLLSRLRRGLQRSSVRLGSVFSRHTPDPEALEELEDELIAADLGVGFAEEVLTHLSREARRGDREDGEALRPLLARLIEGRLQPFEKPLILSDHKPEVLVFVGVNGAGKTTVLGKIAAQYQNAGKKVLIAGCDTFRAAASEQLEAWSQRAGAVLESRHQGADAAGLAYDACARAKREGFDLVLIDTAGRLHNRQELMEELAKIMRALKKLDASAPHHVLLVLDATVGQNALSQAKAFQESAGVTGLIMNKLDGTAKGGVLIPLTEQQKLPVHYIGLGEDVEDLAPFNARAFARALVGMDDENKV